MDVFPLAYYRKLKRITERDQKQLQRLNLLSLYGSTKGTFFGIFPGNIQWVAHGFSPF